MRTTGTTFSAVGHLGLIGWLILGWGFDAEPLEFDDVPVSIISGEEFEQITAARTPVPGTADPTVPVPPQIDETPPPPPAEEERTETAPPPDPVEPPDSDLPPPPAPPTPPDPEVPDTLPVAPDLPAPLPSTPDVDVTGPPTPRQAPVVAPNPSVPTAPDTPIDVIERPEVETERSDDPVVEVPEEDPTTLEDRTDQIVIVDETPSGLVETSLRPTARPSRPAPPAVTPEVDTQTAEVDTPEENEGQSVDDVLAGLGLEDETSEPVAEAPALPLGQGLSRSESGAFLSAVGNKWIVDNGAESANITVVIRFSVSRDRRIEGAITLESASEGSAGAQAAAFNNAKRAVLRLAQGGALPLPEGKYEAWRNVRLTFDPSEMRVR